MDKMWDNLKTFFIEEYKALKEDNNDNLTTKKYQINLVKDSKITFLEKVRDATISEKENNQQLNNILMNKINEKHNESRKIKNFIDAMSKKLNNIGSNKNTRRNNWPKNKNKLFDKGYYCYFWTHGCTGNYQHISQNCTRPDGRHEIESTIGNKIRGSNALASWNEWGNISSITNNK